jgi:hypothetical protein
VLLNVDAPPLMLDPTVLSGVEPGVWPWHLVVFLGTGRSQLDGDSGSGLVFSCRFGGR